MASLNRLVVGGRPRAWERVGFVVRDGRVHLDGVSLDLDPDDAPDHDGGIRAWALDGVGEPLDGLATVPPGAASAADEHPNGVTRLDHVVVLTRDLTVTEEAFVRAGLDVRGRRDVPGSGPARQQVFFVLGSAVCELVGPVEGSGQAGTARLWGLAFVARDLDATVDAMGLLSGPIRDAVQPGRRIATIRHRLAGLPVPAVVMSPRR